MPVGLSQFSRAEIERLSPEVRQERLAELRAALDARLASLPEDDYWRQIRPIVEELRAAGHDLWSHDSDGERRELWGWDYTRLDTAGYLQIQFCCGGRVRTFWRGEDGRLGVDREAD